MSEPCQYHDVKGPDCGRPAVADGYFCDQHGCVRCGYVIAADYEDELLCFECGDEATRLVG